MLKKGVKMHLSNIYLVCFYLLSLFTIYSCGSAIKGDKGFNQHAIQEVNMDEMPLATKTIAIVGAMIISGLGGEPILDGSVLVKDGKIIAVGPTREIKIPNEAEVMDARGLTLLPGFIDSHFHLDRIKNLPAMFLQNGVTSLRDPGAWIEVYDEERVSGNPIPRLFLTGPHLDMNPAAYPYDAVIVRDGLEAETHINQVVDQGASAIKVYFRLPLDLIRQVCEAAHKRGIPVTAHLEMTDPVEAIEVGVDGIEHITSFGMTLLPKREREKYKQSILNDNNARKDGRYAVWKDLDINSEKVDSLIKFLAEKGTYVSPTLGAFEYQADDLQTDSVKLIAFDNMKSFTGKLKNGGVRVVVGSHSSIPYAELGWAFQREMELLVESGISNSDVIQSATIENAQFFRIEDRLGSIEEGKIADLILIKGNPLADIKATRNIKRVMLNGTWVSSQK
jgi:imidazolonepropionase-like amidohydrolase